MKQVIHNTPNYTSIDPFKLLLNVGSLMDIPTGGYVKGLKGESLLNGGLCSLCGVVGRPNNFKSTIAHYLILSGAANIANANIAPYINTYDTETNIHPSRLLQFTRTFPEFSEVDILREGMWMVTDVTKHHGNEWFKMLKDFLRSEKIKNAKSYTFTTPFPDEDGKPFKTLLPTFGELDSLSKFLTSDVEEIQDKNEIGESGGNMVFARSGLGKARLLSELPIVCAASSHYTVVTAHVTDINTIGMLPHQRPVKKLQHMRQDEKIKGVPDDFLSLTGYIWCVLNSSVYNNQTTKGPEFPKVRTFVDEGSTDLNLVTIKLIRNKSGLSGGTVKLLVSQTEGVLPSLSEFLYIKESDRFGLEGNNNTYNLVLYPSVKVGRTTVREVIDTNPLFRRAVKITSDLCQIKEFYKTLPIEMPNLNDLYSKLDKQYGWDKLLATRDNWTFDQYENKVPYLSAMDILNIYYDTYKPYWV